MSSSTNATSPSAGLPVSNNLEPGSHSVQFYRRDEFLVQELSRFLGSALGSGDAAIVIATKAHREQISRLMTMRGLDVVLATRQRRYVSLDAADTLAKITIGGWPDAARFIAVIGEVIAGARAAAFRADARVAAFGEMVALLCAEGKSEAAVLLEHLWNDLARIHSFSLRCAYSLTTFSRSGQGDAFEKICAAHTHVIPSEQFTVLTSDKERLRTVSHLEQKAEALDVEIAERKKAEVSLMRREAEFADLLENAVVGVQQVGADQRIVWANRYVLSLLGYSAEGYVGHQLSEFHAKREIFEDFWQRLMNRQNVCDFPAELRCKDGSVKHVLIHSNGLWEDGRFVRTRCFLRDITEHRQMELALIQSEKLATVGRLAATVAHEINNPLASVMNLVYLARNEAGSPASSKYLGEAQEELERIAHLTKQTLGFYRSEGVTARIRLSSIVRSVAAMLGPKVSNKRVQLTIEDNGDPEILTAPGEIRQLFSNLLSNSLDAVEVGGIIRVRICQAEEWSNSGAPGARVTIADSGCGIPPENRSRLFEPFFTTKKEVGTGLGLWVCKRIVEKHQGTIHFRSNTSPGKSGTVVSVFLPLAGEPAENSIAPLQAA
jgi:PAS domain S-box-containing protein